MFESEWKSCQTMALFWTYLIIYFLTADGIWKDLDKKMMCDIHKKNSDLYSLKKKVVSLPFENKSFGGLNDWPMHADQTNPYNCHLEIYQLIKIRYLHMNRNENFSVK